MDLSYVFTHYRVDKEKLLEYGFEVLQDQYILKMDLSKEDFYALIMIQNDSFSIKVYDRLFDEEYVLFALKKHGAFAAEMKEEILKKVDEIVAKCFVYESLKAKIYDYVYKIYQTLPEYPWERSPEHGTLKTKYSQKWYGIVMTITGQSLGLLHDEKVTVMNLKNKPEKIQELIDYKHFFPAYHMNKKYWISILIDNSLDENVLYKLIDESYNLVEKKKA